MKVYIIHGYTASPEQHWFPWLEKSLKQMGIECYRLAMPDSNNPAPEKWITHLEQSVEIDEQTIIVGHSLGTLATLSFLAKNNLQPAATVLVSGFYQPLHTIPELTPFAEFYAKLTTCSNFKSYVIAALDDHIVPHQYSDALAQHLKADYYRLSQGGHFLAREGWTTFPLVLEIIQQLHHAK